VGVLYLVGDGCLGAGEDPADRCVVGRAHVAEAGRYAEQAIVPDRRDDARGHAETLSGDLRERGERGLGGSVTRSSFRRAPGLQLGVRLASRSRAGLMT
jgi:hypothetical protein